MNCVECQALLQQALDEGALPRPELRAAHLASCPACRDLHCAAQRLLDGLRLLPAPRPPDGLAERIYQQVLAERRRALRTRRRHAALALAASVLFLSFALYLALPPRAPMGPRVAAEHNLTMGTPSLHHHLQEAGRAVVALTRRTADETVDQTRLLLPLSLPNTSVATAPVTGPLFDPPVRSLREIQEGMSAGLEPVASSARRAVGLFWRELPQ